MRYSTTCWPKTVVTVALAWVVSLTGPLAEPLAAAIELRSRALVPGEPVRILVVTEEPLLFAEGSFLGRRVPLAPDGTDAGGAPRWAGWSMIGLDQSSGVEAVEISGRTVSGRAVVGTKAVTIARKRFPTEELSVEPKYVVPPPDVRERIDRERAALAAVYASKRPGRRMPGPFVRPVPGEATSEFGTRRVFNGKPRSPHSGLDLRAATGTPVVASGPGRVALAGDLYFSGLTVILDHGGGLFTVYAHLSSIEVADGDDVRAGQSLGLSGATGRVTGPHLHWGAKIRDEPFDPAALLDQRLF